MSVDAERSASIRRAKNAPRTEVERLRISNDELRNTILRLRRDAKAQIKANKAQQEDQQETVVRLELLLMEAQRRGLLPISDPPVKHAVARRKR